MTRETPRTVRWYGGGDLPLNGAFAWVITGEAEFGHIAQEDFRWMRENYEALLKVGAQDFDTWIHAAPMARRAIALDWFWDSGYLSEAEKSELADLFITDSLKYPHVVMHHRVPPHANNQGMAQALNLVVVGYLLGHKRGADPRGQYLMEFGIPHLLQQIALLPPDGYCGEGSTYMSLVADPLMALACAVLEEISGENFLDREFAPSRNSAARVLRLNAKVIPPSGLLPAWDQHGYHLQKCGTTAAYLAGRSGDSKTYLPFLFGDGWEMSGSFAWMRDDHVWQLLWMPEPGTVSPPETGVACYPESWAEDRVGGALIDANAHLHLFQMWDLSGPRPVRGHMNPNSILLEAWGSVLTVDGNGLDNFYLSADERTHFYHWAMEVPETLSWAPGSLGAHSVIWVDGNIAHTCTAPGFDNAPDTTCTGHLRRRVERADFQLLAAEVAQFYHNAYDVGSMIRGSALIENAFWVILDQIQAETDHEFTWQLVLRSGAKATDYGARLVTAEHVVLDILHLDQHQTEILDVSGYPSTLECQCHHLRKSARGREVEFVTVLVPQLAREQIFDWSQGWSGRADPEDQGIREGWPSEQASVWAPMELRDAYYERAGTWQSDLNQDPSAVWFARECALDGLSAGEELLLELPRTYACRVWLDGEELEVPPLKSTHHREPRLLPPFVDVTARMAGKERVRVTLRIAEQGRFGLSGGVRLHRRVPVATPRVDRAGDVVHLSLGQDSYTCDLREIRTEPSPLPTYVPEGDDWSEAANRLIHQFRPITEEPQVLDWHGDAATRQKACILAMRRPLAEVEEDLLRCARDPDWLVRLLSIVALGEHRSVNAVEALREILRGETAETTGRQDYPPRYRIKEMAACALAKIGDRSAAPDLEACLTPEDFYGVRRIAAEALGKLGGPENIAALETWSEDSDPETKFAALRAISRIRLASDPAPATLK